MSATVRFYCQGIGDCHLLKFRRKDGSVFRMLIDCGVHPSVSDGNKTVSSIVDDLIDATGPDHRIDVVVATHEHWDHNSGFFTAAPKFRKLDIGEVWMAWSEDPEDEQAQQLDKFKTQAIAVLRDTGRRLAHVVPATADSARREQLAALDGGLRGLAGFSFGAKGEKVRSARDAIVALAPNNVRYLEPVDDPITLPDVPDVRVFVLGPPRDPKMLGIRERASEMYGLDSPGWPAAHALGSALDADIADREGGPFSAPFEPNLGTDFGGALDAASKSAAAGAETPEVAMLREHYAGHGDDWRRIDHDWLTIGADLAMQIDDRTNNTSLVLAFEFTDTGRVMLFAADAQVGNWLSWQNVKWKVGDHEVSGPDLLARTVFYKVGHHGSHNATLKEKGLELMKSDDLSAFIPTNKADAVKVKWGEMPFDAILKDLRKRTKRRVIRADDPWVGKPTIALEFTPPSGSIRGIRHKQNVWVEIDIA